jgi:hypothetical protein
MKAFFQRRQTPESRPATGHDELGQNRVFYVRDAGLVTSWYLAQRCEEECYRAERYERPLSLVLVDAPSDEGPSSQSRVRSWLAKELRKADITAYLGSGRYAVLLPETSKEEAQVLASRLAGAVDGAAAGVSAFPDDGSSLENLLEAAERGQGLASPEQELRAA